MTDKSDLSKLDTNRLYNLVKEEFSQESTILKDKSIDVLINRIKPQNEIPSHTIQQQRVKLLNKKKSLWNSLLEIFSLKRAKLVSILRKVNSKYQYVFSHSEFKINLNNRITEITTRIFELLNTSLSAAEYEKLSFGLNLLSARLKETRFKWLPNFIQKETVTERTLFIANNLLKRKSEASKNLIIQSTISNIDEEVIDTDYLSEDDRLSFSTDTEEEVDTDSISEESNLSFSADTEEEEEEEEVDTDSISEESNLSFSTDTEEEVDIDSISEESRLSFSTDTEEEVDTDSISEESRLSFSTDTEVEIDTEFIEEEPAFSTDTELEARDDTENFRDVEVFDDDFSTTTNLDDTEEGYVVIHHNNTIKLETVIKPESLDYMEEGYENATSTSIVEGETDDDSIENDIVRLHIQVKDKNPPDSRKTTSLSENNLTSFRPHKRKKRKRNEENEIEE